MTGYYTYMDNKGGYNNAGKVVEVLAPAGSLDICKAVINAGADAVYLGGDMFGARAYAGNLNQEEMFEALDYAHKLDRHIYLTVNTLLKQNEIEGQLIDYIAPFYERGLDAVIVQDLGVMRLIRQNFPDMDIHASTQMTQTGVEGAGLLYKAGAVRVVTSREMTLGEIKKLHEAYPDMEIESFVHGAMCYCYSGQCLMSSFNGGRSGNRGRCAQPCRLPYKVYDGQNIINNQDEKYALSPKDMCALKILPDVIDAGVYSLKIEGRMKNVTYAAYVTSIYRKYVDKYIANGRKGYKVSDKDIEQLCDIYNRGAFTTGFYDTGKGRDMMALTRPNHWGVKALQVVSNVKGKITFKALTDINRQDVFEIDKEHSFESGSDIKKGQTMVVNLPKKYDLAVGKVLNRMKNAYLTELVKKSYVDCNTCISVDIYFKALKGEKAELTISSKDVYVTVYGEEVQQASKQAATKENIKNKLLMMGQTGYIAGQVEVVIDRDIFMPVSEIKKLRREALLQLDKKLIEVHQRSCKITAAEEINDSYKQDVNQHQHKECLKSVYLYNVQHLDTVLMTENVKRVYIDFDIFYRDEDEFSKALGKAAAASDIELYIGLPYILTQDNHELLCSLFDYVDTHFEGKVNGYLIKDMAGVLTPYKAYDLVKRIKKMTDIPIDLHTHCTGGIADMIYMKAVEAGVDIIDTAISPFSGGTSQPPTESLSLTFSEMERNPGLDMEKLLQVAEYFKPIRDKYMSDKILNPKVLLTEPQTLKYQVPGGMLSNLLSQLKQQNAEDKYEDVLKEVPRVRKDLGYPPLVTPMSQMVGTQALFNVLTGERYKLVPKDFCKITRFSTDSHRIMGL